MGNYFTAIGGRAQRAPTQTMGCATSTVVDRSPSSLTIDTPGGNMPRLTLACRDPGLGDLEANPRYHVDGLTGSPRPSNDSGSGEELDLGSTSESTDSHAEQGSESYNGAAAEGFEKHKNLILKKRRSKASNRPDKNNNKVYK